MAYQCSFVEPCGDANHSTACYIRDIFKLTMSILIHLVVVVIVSLVAFWIIEHVQDGMVKKLLQVIAVLILLVWLVQGWNFSYGIHF